MDRKDIDVTIRTITGRSVPGGGFSEQFGSPGRTDATAWAILALTVSGANPAILAAARSWLASEQLEDGRVCLAKDQPHALWPTSVALLAWNGSVKYRKQRDLAIHFLIGVTGKHWKKNENSPLDHDTSIKGWPWIEDTFAWVEPTALSIIALNSCGYAAHARVREAVRLLMDRQLSSGGWNYGNTIVYGQELYPQPESTGMALAALAGQLEKKEIERSLVYLRAKAAVCRTPLSLSWTLFGLGAWEERPRDAGQSLVECLSRQKRYGAYGTSLLSLILLAYEAKGGFLEAIS